jgi:hypothetical protein
MLAGQTGVQYGALPAFNVTHIQTKENSETGVFFYGFIE